MDKQAIKLRIVKTEVVDIGDLEPFQGTLKTLSTENFDKLKKLIIDEGFAFAVHVWESAGVKYIIDGHQRVSVLMGMETQGYDIPRITCNFISARTYSEAKKLVLMAVSQYGKLNKDGFDQFIEGEVFDFESDFDFPDVDKDFLNWDEGEPSEVTGAKELDEGDFSEFAHQCPKCGFEYDDKK